MKELRVFFVCFVFLHVGNGLSFYISLLNDFEWTVRKNKNLHECSELVCVERIPVVEVCWLSCRPRENSLLL